MTPEFFGQFLLRRGEIGEDALREALDLMDELNPKLGSLAVAEGFASEADCRRVNDEQRRTDLPFGELALQMGVLNSIELEELLQQQRETRVDLAAALVELGFLPDDRARDLLDEWKSEQAPDLEASAELPAALHGSPSAERVVGLLPRMLRRVAALEALLGEAEEFAGSPGRELVASVEVGGTRPLRVTLRCDTSFGERLARGLLAMQLDEVPAELSRDAVGEFLNVLLGNVACTLETRGHQLRLGAPSYAAIPTRGWRFPIVTEDEASADLVLEPRATASRTPRSDT